MSIPPPSKSDLAIDLERIYHAWVCPDDEPEMGDNPRQLIRRLAAAESRLAELARLLPEERWFDYSMEKYGMMALTPCDWQRIRELLHGED